MSQQAPNEVQNKTIIFTPEQQKILDANSPLIIGGIPGSGKTTILLEKARRLAVQHGHGAVGLVSFTYRGALFLERLLGEPKVQVGTVRDFAVQALSEGGQAPGAVIDNTRVRQVLRQAMRESRFEGTLNEAEHILRRFKGRPKAPAPEERYYGLVRAYRQLCEDQGLTDRHDVIRQHIIGVSQQTLKPLPFKYLLVDNLQDANALQLVWLKKHAAAGSVIIAAICPDITLFGPDGALGVAAQKQLVEAVSEIQQHTLRHNWRSVRPLVQLQDKTAGLLKERLTSSAYQAAENKRTSSAIEVQQFDNKGEEFVALLQFIKDKNLLNNCNIGVICKDDRHSNHVTAWLAQRGMVVSNLSQNVWDTPGAQVLLDLLSILLNIPDDAHDTQDTRLRRVMVGYGLPSALVVSFFNEGLVANDWLKRGAPLPDTVEVPVGSLPMLGTIQRRLAGGWRLMVSKQASAREVFKAAAHDLLINMDQADQDDALLALDILLHLKGKLKEILPEIRHQKPYDHQARISILPVREARNLSFDEVWIMDLGGDLWPATNGQALGVDPDHERRLLLMAQSRARKALVHSAVGRPGAFYEEVDLFQRRHAKR